MSVGVIRDVIGVRHNDEKLKATVKVILIGPLGVGKSTVAEYLSCHKGMTQYFLDNHCFDLYLHDKRFKQAAVRCGATNSVNGISDTFALLRDELGEAFEYFEEALHLKAVQLVLSDRPAAIVDLGSGHTSFRYNDHQAAIISLLLDKSTLCLWPSVDIDRSADILMKRNQRTLQETVIRLNQNLASACARFTIYTETKSVESVADEVLEWLDPNNQRE